MDYLELFYANFYNALMPLIPTPSPQHPYSTGNMARGVSFVKTEDYVEVNIIANDDNGEDYVGDVNEGRLAKYLGRARTPLEEQNYHIIQLAINQASELTGDIVEWQGGNEFEIY